MEELVQRLHALAPTINEIMRLSGCPGASIGIRHQKKIIFKEGYGFRDVKKKLKPDEHTIYYLASLSKSFTAALVGMLVEDKKLKWTDSVMPLLPRATHWDPIIREQSTIVDWMSHRTGLAPKNLIWSQEFGHLSMRRKDALPTISYLEKISDFRTRWLYSNWGYALADEVVTRLSGKSWGTMLKEQIFEPLGMSRTITEHDPSLDNVSESYMALSNGTPYHLPQPSPEDGKVMEGAVAVQSNVHDLLNYYAATLFAAEDQKKRGSTSTEGNPLKQVSVMLEPYINLDAKHTGLERSYGLGWIRTELPGQLGVIGLNPRITKTMPIVGKGLGRKVLCIYHQGSNNSFLSSVHCLPESSTVIVVLTNCLGNNDTADWLGELLLQTVLNVPAEHQHDYVTIAMQSAKRSSTLWLEMAEELEKERVSNTQPRDLRQYVGKYFNAVMTYHVEVLLKDGKLMMCFQGDHDQLYDLEHYHYDVFSWLLTQDEDVRRGRFPITRGDFYLFSFQASEDDGGDIDRMVWKDDPAVPNGEIFRKDFKMGSGEGEGKDKSEQREGPA
jgi:CubicO group peptidase (beta-lactamase class C family)